MIGSCNILKTT